LESHPTLCGLGQIVPQCAPEGQWPGDVIIGASEADPVARAANPKSRWKSNGFVAFIELHNGNVRVREGVHQH
jgi:hypothetical protein